MLEEKLRPVLKQIRAEPDHEQKYQVTVKWFQENRENMFSDLSELGYLCDIENRDERHLLVAPVIGNWHMERLEQFIPENEMQSDLARQITNIIDEMRFTDSAWTSYYKDHFRLLEMKNEFTIQAVDNLNDAEPIHTHLHNLFLEIMPVIEKRQMRVTREDADINHTLYGGMMHYKSPLSSVELAINYGPAKKPNVNIMVVDDTEAQSWHEQMIECGFLDIKGQRDYFHDCESALYALENGGYPVILSDIDLGSGKMDGIEFAQRAYQIQEKKGISPLICVFSYNKKLVERADKELYFENPQIVTVQSVNKIHFDSMNFARKISNTLYGL